MKVECETKTKTASTKIGHQSLFQGNQLVEVTAKK